MSPHGKLVRDKSGLPTLTLYSQCSCTQGPEILQYFKAVLNEATVEVSPNTSHCYHLNFVTTRMGKRGGGNVSKRQLSTCNLVPYLFDRASLIQII